MLPELLARGEGSYADTEAANIGAEPAAKYPRSLRVRDPGISSLAALRPGIRAVIVWPCFPFLSSWVRFAPALSGIPRLWHDPKTQKNETRNKKQAYGDGLLDPNP